MTTATEPKPPAPQSSEPPAAPTPPDKSYASILKFEYARMALVRPIALAAQPSGVFMVVAVQHFNAHDYQKSLIASASFIGMIAAPLIVNLVARSTLTVSKAISLMQLLASFFLLITIFTNNLTGFMIGTLLGMPLIAATMPMVTAMWRQIVPGAVRGKHFSRVVLVAVAIGLTIASAITWYMDNDAGRYRPVVAVLAVLLFLSAMFARLIPTKQIENKVGNPIALLKILWQHKEFGYLSAAWMLLGFSNLATLPLRVQYLASSGYGFDPYTPEKILSLTLVIPLLLQFVATPFWGIVFDRANFIITRICINTMFAASIFLFFMPNFYFQIAGSVAMGVGMGGGMVAWSLWVTKYAPPDRTADYMAVHTFLTGCRGLVAPFYAFTVVSMFSMHTVTYISVAGIIIATLMIVPLIRKGSTQPKSAQSVEKPPDMVN